jgi:hypothetical protein
MQHTQSVADFIPGFKATLPEKRHPSNTHDDHMRASMVVNSVNVWDEPSIVVGEGSRRRFTATYSVAQEYEQGKRHISPPKRSNSPPRGKRYIPAAKGSGEELGLLCAVKRRIPDASMKRSESTELQWSKKGRVTGENGISAALKESGELNIETTMNRKQRVIADIDRRNGIPIARPGDNPFKKVDHETGYFEKGGLIPGSTNTLKPSGKPTMRKSESSSAQITAKPLEATYGKMKARLEMEYDLAQVHALTVSNRFDNR